MFYYSLLCVTVHNMAWLQAVSQSWGAACFFIRKGIISVRNLQYYWWEKQNLVFWLLQLCYFRKTFSKRYCTGHEMMVYLYLLLQTSYKRMKNFFKKLFCRSRGWLFGSKMRWFTWYLYCGKGDFCWNVRRSALGRWFFIALAGYMHMCKILGDVIVYWREC